MHPPPRRGVGGVERAEPDQDRSDRGLRGAGGAVGDLQRDAEALPRQDRHEHALRPGLERRAAARRLHELRAGPALAGDQGGVERHRLAQADHRPAAAVRVPRGGEARHRAGERVERRGEVRRRAAVHRPVGARHPGRVLERLAHGALHGVVDLHVLGAAAEAPVERQEPRMLARAVVVQLARRRSRADQRVAGVVGIGHVRAAAQVGLGPALVGEPRGGELGVHRRALVRGAGQRDAAGIAHGLRLHERQGLEHLAGRPRVDDHRRVAPALADAGRVRDHGGDAVHALDAGPAMDAHQLLEPVHPATLARNLAARASARRPGRAITRSDEREPRRAPATTAGPGRGDRAKGKDPR